MKFLIYGAIGAVALALGSTSILAQPDEPVVSMTVTPPTGQAQDLNAADSHVATLRVDGVEYGFEPTVEDSRPWDRVTITVFKMPTSTESTVVLGEAELRAGGSTVTTKTTPSFKVSVPKVSPPESMAGQSTGSRT